MVDDITKKYESIINKNIQIDDKKKIFIVSKIKKSQLWTEEEDLKLKSLVMKFNNRNLKETIKELLNKYISFLYFKLR